MRANKTFITKRERSNIGSAAMSAYSPLKARPPKLCGAKDCKNKRQKQGYCRRHGAEKLGVVINEQK